MPGHPQAEFRRHHTVSTGEFAPGAPIAQAGVIRTLVPIWSSSRVRIRFEADVSGNLRALIPPPGLVPGRYVHWDDDLEALAAISAEGPSDKGVAINAEVIMELGTVDSGYELAGEAYVLLEFTENDLGAGTVTHCIVSQA